MKHPHAELMMQYAQDAMETDKPWERWEFRIKDSGDWKSFIIGNPEWRLDNQYRRKPKTININGFEVPEPVRDANVFTLGYEYWFPCLSHYETVDWHSWSGDDEDWQNINRGIIHMTRKDAMIHAKALLSFTERKK